MVCLQVEEIGDADMVVSGLLTDSDNRGCLYAVASGLLTCWDDRRCIYGSKFIDWDDRGCLYGSKWFVYRLRQ